MALAPVMQSAARPCAHCSCLGKDLTLHVRTLTNSEENCKVATLFLCDTHESTEFIQEKKLILKANNDCDSLIAREKKEKDRVD